MCDGTRTRALITIGSIANLITIEQASRFGITISFKEYARTGMPVTLVSIGVLIFWTILPWVIYNKPQKIFVKYKQKKP